jgi:hypothetical protein
MAFFTLFQLIFIDPAVTLDAVYIIHIDYGYVEIHRRYKSLTKLLSFFYTLGAKKLFKSTDAFVLFCFVFRWRGEVNAGLVWSRTADTNSYTKIFLFFFFRLNESRYILRSCAPEIYGDDYTRVVFWLAISK